MRLPCSLPVANVGAFPLHWGNPCSVQACTRRLESVIWPNSGACVSTSLFPLAWVFESMWILESTWFNTLKSWCQTVVGYLRWGTHQISASEQNSNWPANSWCQCTAGDSSCDAPNLVLTLTQEPCEQFLQGVKLNNLAAIELNIIRPFMTDALGMFLQHQTAKHSR